MSIHQGMLKMLVVQRLTDGPSSGYKLVKDIAERSGWKPSYGSIYPLLERMQHEGLLTVKAEGRSKVYSLTSKGVQYFRKQQDGRVQLFSQFSEQLKILECLGEEEANAAQTVLEMLKRGEIPFQEIPEATELKYKLFNLLNEGKTKTHRKQIRAALARTIRELEKL
jgi:DNA-binding PadR family transcriptional regulator